VQSSHGGESGTTLIPKLVSVIIPVLDAEEHVGQQLAALAGQTYPGDWELVVADNGCKDRTLDVVRAWSGGRRVAIADATAKRGINHARNAGAAAASGDFLAFCDADDVATPGWLEALVAAARHGEVVGGALDFEALNDRHARSLSPWDPPSDLSSGADGFMPYVPGGNCGMPRTVALDVGWDGSLTFGSSDIDFSWRAQLRSYRLRFAPDAVMQQRLPRRLPDLARRFYAYGKSDPALYRKFRGLGMPRPAAEGGASWRELARRLPDLTRSAERRAYWVRAAARKSGRVVGSVEERVLLL
jgi:glycosyltransferase involved in cell wall biosynthesis